jgi:hypothetical protein
VLFVFFLEFSDPSRGRSYFLIGSVWISLVLIKCGKVKHWHFIVPLILAKLVSDRICRCWDHRRSHELTFLGVQLLLLHFYPAPCPDLLIKLQRDVAGLAVDFGIRVDWVRNETYGSKVAITFWVYFLSIAAVAVLLVEVCWHSKLMIRDLQRYSWLNV